MPHRHLPSRYLGALLAWGLFANLSFAQDAASSPLHQRANASMCANCHGTDGHTVPGSSVPSIAGLPRDYTVQQMQAFKNGTRPATIMHQISKGLSDAQILSLADYFAAQPR